uniref:23S rRNA (guanosine-2'-O-)-methyltransferase RlmB n=1 Tax=Candidatus Kentrum sp. FM TaxID=2126340 RepID=A0A450T5A9_9GAMM|nr:MAG: 23S rRNA (guanosine2251-2'-O)-methyltransferase [Candidatus Kentron sp. FM]
MTKSPTPSDLIYGHHAVEAVLSRNTAGQDTAKVLALFIQENRKDARTRRILEWARLRHIPVNPTPRKVLDEMAGGMRHQGFILRATGPDPAWRRHDLPSLLKTLSEPALLLILDGVQDPHNLGACLRSADGAGVHGVVAPRDRAVGLTPTVRKVACGAAESVPFIRIVNLARSLDELRIAGVGIIGLTGEADESLYDLPLTGPIALVLGGEGKGLRRLTRAGCDRLARLPMRGTVESLNVSVTAGICLYEARRQRGKTDNAPPSPPPGEPETLPQHETGYRRAP